MRNVCKKKKNYKKSLNKKKTTLINANFKNNF